MRVRATAETDGELRLVGLPLRKGDEAEVIVFTGERGDEADQALLSVLTHDPSWAWLREEAEDVYTDEDVS